MKCKELFILFRNHLKKCIQHNFIYRWQAEQFKECILQFPKIVVLFVVHCFFENYTFKEEKEVHTMHWYFDHVTIFFHITYVCVVGVVYKYHHFYVFSKNSHMIPFLFKLHYFSTLLLCVLLVWSKQKSLLHIY